MSLTTEEKLQRLLSQMVDTMTDSASSQAATLDGSEGARPPAVYPINKTLPNAVVQNGGPRRDLKFRLGNNNTSGATIDGSSEDEDDRLLGGSVDSSDPSWALGAPTTYIRVVAPESYPKEHHKLVCVLLVFFLAAASNWAALAYIHDYVGRTPLPDVVFALVPEQAWALRVGDTLVTVCTWSMILTAILHKHRWIVIRRVGVIGATLYSMRTLSLLSTLLPSGYADNKKECRARLNATDWSVFVSRFLEQSLHIGFQQADRGFLCGDLLFSGHTLAMVLSAFTVSYYSPKKLWLWHYLLHAAAIVGMCCMILCRTHYTVDVIFAYWLTAGLFTLYHGYCEIMSVSQRRESAFGRLLLFSIVGWLECHFPAGRLQNGFEWPFSYPDCCVQAMRKWSLTEFDSRTALNRRPDGHISSDVPNTRRQQNGYVHSI